MARENKFQAGLVNEIRERIPGCIIMHNDANYIQGIPDILVLSGDRWGALECKRDAKASHRPNQDYYVNLMDEMSYAAFVYPENKEEVLNELQQALKPRG